ncbi:MAG TPA: GAF domain-containing protein [Kofleriaceae bacterium]|nr:GAF domain-containing protein [Kofleriaceae bacterium]
MARSSRSIIHVHHRGDRGVDGILRLIELASHDGPLEAMLTAMCDEIAAIMSLDIASIYVAEDDRLVMRGNYGFPASAIGTTTLAVGEGITGLVAECMRPVSAAHAAAEAAYKEVPGLGEERFPVFAGVPLISGGAVVGVLVLQRRKKPFAADEVTLATALGAPATLAIERRLATAVRSARLLGTPRAGTGVVLGRAGVVPTATALAGVLRAPTSDAAGESADVDRVFGRLRDDLGRALKKLGDVDDPLVGSALDRFTLALCDQRLRERLAAAASEPSGLRSVAKDYARAAHRNGTEDQRALEIEELCAIIGMTLDARTSARPGAVWLADRIGAVVALVAVARGASALVASDAASATAVAIARAAGLPLVTGVSGAFGWVRPGDLLAVDGGNGIVLVHPAPTEIERLRSAGSD